MPASSLSTRAGAELALRLLTDTACLCCVIDTPAWICRSATDDAIVDLVRQHVPASSLSTRGGTELAFKLPRDETISFAALLTALEERKAELGVLSCGLSVTTLEEVFLKVSSGSSAALDQKQAAAYSQPQAVSLRLPLSLLQLVLMTAVSASLLWCESQGIRMLWSRSRLLPTVQSGTGYVRSV